MENKIEIYRTTEGNTEISVKFEQETVWLNQEQLVTLFERDQSVISRHIRNIFNSEELDEKSNMQKLHIAFSDKPVSFYNLDVIISVGYRINSKRGTQFRQWATQRLKEFLVQGYAINENRLKQKQQEVEYLKTGIRILSRAIENNASNIENETIKMFSKGLELLDDYDHEQLDAKGKTLKDTVYPTEIEYLTVINEMKSDFNSSVFAKAKDQSFSSSVNQIKQTFDNVELYPSIEEKAAMLLYLIVKNHSFADGNKRIGAACFLYFLMRNHMLTNSDNKPILSNEALAALTLFTANSRTDEMHTVTKLIVSILNRNNV